MAVDILRKTPGPEELRSRENVLSGSTSRLSIIVMEKGVVPETTFRNMLTFLGA